MLVDAARESRNPNLRAIIFRKELTQLTDIVEKSHRLFGPMDATYSPSTWTWTFPSGATIRFAYISTDEDIWKYMGPRYSFIGFDESTFHSEYQIRNMLGRLSSTDRTLWLRMRLAGNPGSTGAGWHKAMFLRGGCPVHSPRHCAEPGRLSGY
jgi:Terminase large subunit, T4likevirus-type, N-terminal